MLHQVYMLREKSREHPVPMDERLAKAKARYRFRGLKETVTWEATLMANFGAIGVSLRSGQTAELRANRISIWGPGFGCARAS